MDRNICIFGDSITWGAGDTQAGGWAERLKIYCNATDPDVQVYNLGISGETTDGVLSRFRNEAIARAATAIVFAIGINDSKLINGEEFISLADFRENILDLIEQAGSLDLQVAFIGLTRVDESKTNPINWRPDTSYDNARIALFDQSLLEICEDRELPYLDVSGVLELEDTPDGVHPNATGYGKLFAQILPFLETRLGL